jgi:hypothetical protein
LKRISALIFPRSRNENRAEAFSRKRKRNESIKAETEFCVMEMKINIFTKAEMETE